MTTMPLENQLKLGNGIYTIPEAAHILELPYHKVNYWINKYWDGELGKVFQNNYSWTVENTKAFSFHTLVEFYVLILFAEAGVKTRQVLNAHKELSIEFDTPFPFAQRHILDSIKTDGKKIYLQWDGHTISLDGTHQLNLDFIKMFFKNLDFGADSLASRMWPRGKKSSIVIDPNRQFGHPIVNPTNIYPQTLFNLFKAGEPLEFISFLYEIDEKKIHDSIEYCQAA